MRKIFGWIKYALLLTVAAGMAGMFVALAKNLAPWLAFCPLAILMGIATPYLLWLWVIMESPGKGMTRHAHAHGWAAGTLAVLALLYLSWTVFGAEKVPCKFSVVTSEDGVVSVCGFVRYGGEAGGGDSDEQNVAVLALETRDEGTVVIYLPSALRNGESLLGTWVVSIGRWRETPVSDTDRFSLNLAAATSGIHRYGPIKSVKYIYPATIAEVPR